MQLILSWGQFWRYTQIYIKKIIIKKKKKKKKKKEEAFWSSLPLAKPHPCHLTETL